MGYLPSALLFAGLIAVVTVAHLRFKLNAVPAFWIAYILTRPLGAALGDYMSQSHDGGGLELGTVVTSAIFLLAILATVVYLIVTRNDVIRDTSDNFDYIEMLPSHGEPDHTGTLPAPEA